MKIPEFYSIFSSKNESSFLFAVLKRVSLLEEIASLSMDAVMWVGWPPDPEPSPGDGSLSGPSPARA